MKNARILSVQFGEIWYHVTTNPNKIENISIPPENSLVPLSSEFPVPTWNPMSNFCHSGLALPEFVFCIIVIFDMYPFVLAASAQQCFRRSSLLLSVSSFILLLNGIHLYRYTTICLSILLLMDISDSTFWLLWLGLWVYSFISLFVDICFYVLVLLDKNAEVELLDHRVDVCVSL